MATVKSKEEVLEQRIKKLRDEIEKKHGKSPEELRTEREKRVKDAIELREPDRVPVTIATGVFACRYAGLPASATYYDHDAYMEACRKVLLDFEPDMGQATAGTSGAAMELLDPKNQAWPGGSLPPDSTYQFLEREFMTADEYDRLLNDPSDFILRYYWPRVFGALAPLAKLPPLRMARSGPDAGLGFSALLPMLTSPEFRQVADKLAKANEEMQKLNKKGRAFAAEMAALGFPTGEGGGGIGHHPFDTVSDYFRSLRGTMLDIFRCPDKLLAACDKILEWRADAAVPANPKEGGIPPRTGMPLHRGSDGFMSIKQFEKFYWPYLKKAALFNINEMGYVFTPFCEGVWDQRLEYLLELPRGKVVVHFQNTDMFKAKEVLGNHICLQGNVHPALLEYGSPQEVEEYCGKLIKICGKGGGLILGTGSSMERAKPANVRAMVDSAKKYHP